MSLAPTAAEQKRMLDAIVALARQVAQQEIMPRFLRVRHQDKDDGTLLTEADLAAQRFLGEHLPAIHSSPVLGEEMSRAEQEACLADSGDGLWCIDPIDGTTNFINGLPYFAVSIAFIHQGQSRIGVVYNPVADEMFYARAGNGAYLNGIRLPLRQVTNDLRRCVASIDFKRMPKPLADHLAVDPPFFSQRNFGSSTLEWCNVAAGRFDLLLHGGQMLWDYAAGSLILREAGGCLCTLDDDDFDAGDLWRRSVIAAAQPAVFATWREWVRAHR